MPKNHPAVYIRSFPPLADDRCNILILGTMPGKASLYAEQYYAHPQNAFWRIMQSLFDIPLNAPYDQRCARLLKKRVAVWDVLQLCERETSGDADIVAETMKTNDFSAFYTARPRIRKLCFNGLAAARIYGKRIAPALPSCFAGLPHITLPSTSPANAAMRFSDKLIRWRTALIG